MNGESAGVATPVLRIRDLSLSFESGSRLSRAVRDLSLELPRGAITCLAGESGCGKSLTCKAVMRLTPENARLSGEILFEGRDLLAISEKELRKIRGAAIGMIFQEPMTSLNPVMKVGPQVAEPLRLHWKASKEEAKARVLELFRQAGIPSPEIRYNDYPHQLSGGLRQRAMIAMALTCKPRLLLADEPTTALDATIQGQILRLLVEERDISGMAVLLVTHDLGVVADVGDFVGVMYAGVLVERASTKALFAKPLHPYTQGLIASSPGRASRTLSRLPTIQGTVPPLGQTPPGCPFQPRCSQALPVCSREFPPREILGDREVVCWLYAR